MSAKEKDVITAYTKEIENRVNTLLEDVPEQIILSALGNILIRKCQKANVTKKHFLKQTGDGWDYHEGKK